MNAVAHPSHIVPPAHAARAGAVLTIDLDAIAAK
jgi:alanine racemase